MVRHRVEWMQWFDPRMAGWYRRGLVPKTEEGREQRKEKREKKEERDQHDQDKSVEGCKGSIPE